MGFTLMKPGVYLVNSKGLFGSIYLLSRSLLINPLQFTITMIIFYASTTIYHIQHDRIPA